MYKRPEFVIIFLIVVVLFGCDFLGIKEEFEITVTVSPTEAGTVSGGGTYEEGSIVTLTATPNTGWVFSKWEGDETGVSNPITVTMDANKAITAVFVEMIEIAGNWSGTDIEGDFTYTIDNASLNSVYSTGNSVAGVVVSFDNSTSSVIVHFIDHYVESVIGQYGRIEWQAESSNTITAQVYETNDSFVSAETATTIVWGPYVLTKA